jgi:arylsulfatase A-like enzyme
MANAAMRQGSWKLVRADEQPWELYYLASDRSELLNLATEQPDVVSQMHSIWHKWARGISAIP